ncbi:MULTISPECIES: ead/Ea22-like family protein [Escherichia]|uniref:ead/Ea22-like family protein n=1 Tax=Escherichia TaxID=561 RepID=UPI0035934E69
MSKIDYQALREIAKLATQGEWVAFISPGKYGTYAVHTPGDNHHGDIVDWPGFDEQKNAENNARYIAAFNPEVVQALLDELEAAKSKLNEQREYYEGVISDGSKRIESLEEIRSAAEKLVRCKGRYHSEQNYRALAALFGVTVPDLPPLEAEPASQTCKLAFLEWLSEQKEKIDVDCGCVSIETLMHWMKSAYEAGNSPVIPDSWISCSARMPEKGENVLISVNFDSSLVEPLICSARYTGNTFRRGDVTIKPGNGIEQATHWMPLPEPPQEVNQ